MAWNEHTNEMIAEDVQNVILDLVRYGVPLETAVLEGWALTKEMVRLTSKDQPGKKDQNVFEDVIDMRRILHTAVDAVHTHLSMEPVAWSHSTLRRQESMGIEGQLHHVKPAKKSYTLAEARKLFVTGNKYLAADVTTTLYLFLNNNQTQGAVDGEPLPEHITDEDLRVEVSLPNQAASGKYLAEIEAVFAPDVLGGSKKKTISLDDVIRLFKIDPDAPIWECSDVD
jgi:hypothetical protein